MKKLIMLLLIVCFGAFVPVMAQDPECQDQECKKDYSWHCRNALGFKCLVEEDGSGCQTKDCATNGGGESEGKDKEEDGFLCWLFPWLPWCDDDTGEIGEEGQDEVDNFGPSGPLDPVTGVY